MDRRWNFLLAVFTAVLLSGVHLATAVEPNIGQNQPAVQGSAGIIQVSTLTGSMVVDPQGKELGRFKDVLLDSQTGQATFTILDAEMPGAGHAMLVVPYQALRVSVNPADHHPSVVLDLRPDRLRAAPQIQNGQWQMLQNPQFLEQARSFYQVRTYYAARPIDNATLPAPYLAPQPNATSAGSGWTRELEGFYNE
jgi:sporulation protein YlmC with PRC-barrel domain